IISANYSLDSNATADTILKRNLHAPLLFALSDQNGKSVVNTSKTIIGTLEFFNPSPLLLGADISMMNSALGRISDIVRVHLVDTSASPLQTSKLPSKVGDTVYLVGYPSETSNRTKVGAPDSGGNSLRISVGKIISFADWKQRTGNNFGAQTESLLQENLVFFDADCEHGNSGGPLLNANGEVIGIMMALYQDVQKGAPYRVCGAVNTLDESKLTALWKLQAQ
ncbi:MAG TPA: serine protease, partial [Pseudobdellovibrionaceae bacterium]